MSKHRIAIKGEVAAPEDQAAGHRFCWHIYRAGKFIYCGLDWATTLDIAREKARVTA